MPRNSKRPYTTNPTNPPGPKKTGRKAFQLFITEDECARLDALAAHWNLTRGACVIRLLDEQSRPA